MYMATYTHILLDGNASLSNIGILLQEIESKNKHVKLLIDQLHDIISDVSMWQSPCSMWDIVGIQFLEVQEITQLDACWGETVFIALFNMKTDGIWPDQEYNRKVDGIRAGHEYDIVLYAGFPLRI